MGRNITIKAYPVALNDEFKLQLPKGSEVAEAIVRNNVGFLNVIESDASETKERVFMAIEPNKEFFIEAPIAFLGTLHLKLNEENAVYHVFEKIPGGFVDPTH